MSRGVISKKRYLVVLTLFTSEFSKCKFSWRTSEILWETVLVARTCTIVCNKLGNFSLTYIVTNCSFSAQQSTRDISIAWNGDILLDTLVKRPPLHAMRTQLRDFAAAKIRVFCLFSKRCQLRQSRPGKEDRISNSWLIYFFLSDERTTKYNKM